MNESINKNSQPTENSQGKSVRVGAGAIIIKDGKILMAKRKGSHNEGNWGTTGGHVEYGETPEQAAIRETREELGIEIGNLRFLCCISEQFKAKQFVDVIFLADIISGQPKISEPNKIVEFGWYPLNQMPEPLFPPIKIGLEAMNSGKAYYEFKED